MFLVVIRQANKAEEAFCREFKGANLANEWALMHHFDLMAEFVNHFIEVIDTDTGEVRVAYSYSVRR